MSKDDLHINTRVLHDAWTAEAVTGATAVPIFQSTAFAYETARGLEDVFVGRDAGYVYSRMGNPTLTAFERRMNALEGGIAAISCASGMAAISSVVLALAGAGDEIISGKSIFGGTYSLFHKTLSRYGIVTRFVESRDVDAYRKAINDKTKLIFVETIGNPMIDVPDIRAIAEVAHEENVVLVVDNTVTTPVLFRPKEAGADIVVHSTSKFINGHGNAIGGIIIDCGSFAWACDRYAHLTDFSRRFGGFAFAAFLRGQICRDIGSVMSPFNAFLMTVGMETLALRMQRHCSNAMKVAEYLEKHPAAQEVRYPGLQKHPDHAVSFKQFGGMHGSLIAVRLESRYACFGCMDALKIVQKVANLGDVRTLVIHPASTFCREMNVEERVACGVSDDLLRFSVGIEDVNDIIDDVDKALGVAGC